MLKQLQSDSNTKLSSKFEKLRARKEGALITYLTGGDPNPVEFNRNAIGLAEGGADIIEIGIPFSDPVADGPVIQASSQRALASGTTPRMIFDASRKLSSAYPEIPIVLLTYYNPVLALGLTRFMKEASESGVSGTVVPDLPVEESSEYQKAAHKHGIDTIFLTAPNTSTARLENIVRSTSGFLYLVSLYGVTGARESLSETLLSSVKRVKGVSRKVPAAAGFGISRPEHVTAVIRSGADGAIVGSTLVRVANENRENARDRLREKVEELKKATRNTDV